MGEIDPGIEVGDPKDGRKTESRVDRYLEKESSELRKLGITEDIIYPTMECIGN